MLFDQIWKWVSGLLAVVVVGLSIYIQYKNIAYDNIQELYTKEQVKAQLAETQIQLFKSEIAKRNDKIKEMELNEKTNLDNYNKRLEKSQKTLKEQLLISSQLKTEKEICDYMVRKSYEILN